MALHYYTVSQLQNMYLDYGQGSKDKVTGAEKLLAK